MVEEATKAGKVLMDAFHYRYHPSAMRMREIIESGEIGEVKSIDVEMLLPGLTFKPDDIRFNLALGGGAMVPYPFFWFIFLLLFWVINSYFRSTYLG